MTVHTRNEAQLRGAIALAASVFFLFYQFWGYFPTAAQVGVLVGVSLGSLLLAMGIARRDATGYFTKLAAMVAFACFVLNVVMLGQIFNITPSDKALLPWAALALLLAYAFELRLLQAAGILCLIAFIAARAGSWGGVYWIHFGERPENSSAAGSATTGGPATSRAGASTACSPTRSTCRWNCVPRSTASARSSIRSPKDNGAPSGPAWPLASGSSRGWSKPPENRPD